MIEELLNDPYIFYSFPDEWRVKVPPQIVVDAPASIYAYRKYCFQKRTGFEVKDINELAYLYVLGYSSYPITLKHIKSSSYKDGKLGTILINPTFKAVRGSVPFECLLNMYKTRYLPYKYLLDKLPIYMTEEGLLFKERSATEKPRGLEKRPTLSFEEFEIICKKLNLINH